MPHVLNGNSSATYKAQGGGDDVEVTLPTNPPRQIGPIDKEDEADCPCSPPFAPTIIARNVIQTNVAADGHVRISPYQFAIWAPCETVPARGQAQEFKIILAPGELYEFDSGWVAWDAVVDVPDGCTTYFGATPTQIWARTTCGSDYAETMLIVQDNDSVCLA